MPKSALMPLAEAMAILRDATAAHCICLGAEGFWLDPDESRPSLDHVLDLSDVSPRNARTNASIALQTLQQWPDEPDRFAIAHVLNPAAYPMPLLRPSDSG